MADNSRTPLLNPIISLLKEPVPSTVTGGGKSRASIVRSRLAQQRKKLVNDLASIKKDSRRIVSHAGKAHFVVRMFDDSTAPSWTPNDLFSAGTLSRIVAPSYDGYLVEIPLSSIDNLMAKITKAKTIGEEVDISRVESVSVFDKEDTLRKKTINELFNDGERNNNRQFNLWLLPFYDIKSRESVINSLLSLYGDGVMKSGFSEFDIRKGNDDAITIASSGKTLSPSLMNAIKKYKREGHASFSIIVENELDMVKIISSGAVYRVEPISHVRANETPPGNGAEPTPQNLKNKDLPTVVIVDGGCSATSYLPLNILSVKPLVSDYDADMAHGNQVTSLVCHGYAWNNNLSLPEVECNFISVQAINKVGVVRQPTTDQFINYLRGVAEETKGISNVWNLSFNESQPTMISSEISYLGHEIGKIAREYNILPVISIGNVSEKNSSRLCPPADCEAALTISGRVSNGQGKPHGPCPLSLKGPAPAGMKKPELSWFSNLRMIGGVSKTGTSYSTPLISSVAAHTFKNLKNPTPDLVRALLINKSGNLEHDIHLGWGTPWNDDTLPWLCQPGTVTLTWISRLKAGYAYYWNDIPLPPEMLVNSLLAGNISLTAILNPIVSEMAGENYFATRLECALQAIDKNDDDLKVKNLLGTMRESKEKENTSRKDLAKWSPVRHHAKEFSRTNIANHSLRLYARIYARDLYQFDMESHRELDEQEVSFVLTFRSNDENSGIYNSMTQRLGAYVESAVINQNIEINL
ncbi:S8 family serine peptidase [Photorhabdus temperata subsp. temperata]